MLCLALIMAHATELNAKNPSQLTLSESAVNASTKNFTHSGPVMHYHVDNDADGLELDRTDRISEALLTNAHLSEDLFSGFYFIQNLWFLLKSKLQKITATINPVYINFKMQGLLRHIK